MSGRAPSLSPKKERSTSRRNGPLERPGPKRRGDTLRTASLIKEEPEDERLSVKAEPDEVPEMVLLAPTTLLADAKEPEVQLSARQKCCLRGQAKARAYLAAIGATPDVPEGCNAIGYDGRILNPTQEVQKYVYYEEHDEEEGKIRCKPDDVPGEHYCHFYREGYSNHGYRYLNANGSVYYLNPDGSEYFVDRWTRWFKPPGLEKCHLL